MPLRTQFLTRKPIVIELGSEIKRIESYMVLIGKRILAFVQKYFRFTRGLFDQNFLRNKI